MIIWGGQLLQKAFIFKLGTAGRPFVLRQSCFMTTRSMNAKLTHHPILRGTRFKKARFSGGTDWKMSKTKKPI